MCERCAKLLGHLEWIATGPLADELTPGHLRVLSLEDRHDMMMHRAQAAIDEAKAAPGHG